MSNSQFYILGARKDLLLSLSLYRFLSVLLTGVTESYFIMYPQSISNIPCRRVRLITEAHTEHPVSLQRLSRTILRGWYYDAHAVVCNAQRNGKH